MSNYATDPESWWDDLPGECTCEPAWKSRGLIDGRCNWHRLIEAVEELRASGWTAARVPLTGEKVWWCQEHRASGRSDTACNPGFEFSESNTCRMVEAVLIVGEEG